MKAIPYSHAAPQIAVVTMRRYQLSQQSMAYDTTSVAHRDNAGWCSPRQRAGTITPPLSDSALAGAVAMCPAAGAPHPVLAGRRWLQRGSNGGPEGVVVVGDRHCCHLGSTVCARWTMLPSSRAGRPTSCSASRWSHQRCNILHAPPCCQCRHVTDINSRSPFAAPFAPLPPCRSTRT